MASTCVRICDAVSMTFSRRAAFRKLPNLPKTYVGVHYLSSSPFFSSEDNLFASSSPIVQNRPRVIFSGIQPTGNLHLGNYLGAIRHWMDLQVLTSILNHGLLLIKIFNGNVLEYEVNFGVTLCLRKVLFANFQSSYRLDGPVFPYDSWNNIPLKKSSLKKRKRAL